MVALERVKDNVIRWFFFCSFPEELNGAQWLVMVGKTWIQPAEEDKALFVD